MTGFIDENRAEFGVEPIEQLASVGVQIAPSAYWTHKTRPASARSRRDEVVKEQIEQIHADNDEAFGARKMYVMVNRPEITT